MEDIIKEQVLKRLDKLEKGSSIFVKHLWDNRYRVNVWRSKADKDRNTISFISHSYFVAVSPEGKIISSNPEM